MTKFSKKILIWSLLSIAVTVILLLLLLSQINIDDIITVVGAIDIRIGVLGFALYFCSYICRTVRFHILLNKSVTLSRLFSIVCVHNIVNQVLPARTGEFSYVVLLKKNHDKSVGEGMASLIVARAFDIIALSLLFFISVLFIENTPGIVNFILVLVALILAFLLVFVTGLILYGNKIMNGIRSAFYTIRLVQFGSVKYLLRKGDETVQSFHTMRSRKQIVLTFVTSVLLWGFHCTMLYILATGMNVILPIISMLFAITFYLLTTFLPISTLGGFGIKEVGWALGFSIVGVPKELAISSGFGFHIIVLVYTILLGGYGFLSINKNTFLRIYTRKNKDI